MASRRQPFKDNIWTKSVYSDHGVHFIGDLDGCELYLGNLPSNFSISECLQLFENFGRVSDIRLFIGNHRYNKTKGYGFVKYHKATNAEEAYSRLNDLEIRSGLKMAVILCRLQRRIYVGNIPTEKADTEIIKTFSNAFLGVKSVNVMKPDNRQEKFPFKQNSGFVIVEFKTHQYARNAKRLLNAGFVRLWRKALLSDWIEPDKIRKHVIMSGVPASLSDHSLFEWLQIVSNNGLVNGNWCYGQLHMEFQTNYQAELVMEQMKGLEIEGSILELRWNLFPVESFYSTGF